MRLTGGLPNAPNRMRWLGELVAASGGKLTLADYRRSALIDHAKAKRSVTSGTRAIVIQFTSGGVGKDLPRRAAAKTVKSQNMSTNATASAAEYSQKSTFVRLLPSGTLILPSCKNAGMSAMGRKQTLGKCRHFRLALAMLAHC